MKLVDLLENVPHGIVIWSYLDGLEADDFRMPAVQKVMQKFGFDEGKAWRYVDKYLRGDYEEAAGGMYDFHRTEKPTRPPRQ